MVWKTYPRGLHLQHFGLVVIWKCTKQNQTLIKSLLASIVPLEGEVIQPSAFFFSNYNLLEHMGKAIFKNGFSFHCSCLYFIMTFKGNSPTVHLLFYVKQSQLLPQHFIHNSHSTYHSNGSSPVFIFPGHKFPELKDCFNAISIIEPGI